MFVLMSVRKHDIRQCRIGKLTGVSRDNFNPIKMEVARAVGVVRKHSVA